MWAAWDFITREMIPPSMLFQKPIDLRHICLFYCGHIPTFLSIHLARLLKEPDTEPIEFKVRGIVACVNPCADLDFAVYFRSNAIFLCTLKVICSLIVYSEV